MRFKRIPAPQSVRELNVEIPSFDPFDFYGFEEADDAEWGLVDGLLTSSHPEQDYGSFWENLPRKSVLFHLGDGQAPTFPGLTVSNQMISIQASTRVVGCLYPVLNPNKERILNRIGFEPISARQKPVDIFFHGWDNQLIGYPERIDMINEVSSWNDFSLDVQLNSSYQGKLSFERWIIQASRAKICLVPPGLGLNSWRLTELMLAGCFCLMIAPATQLRFSPPLYDREHLAFSSIEKLHSTCTYYITRPDLIDRISLNGQDYAKRFGLLSGWKQNIVKRVMLLTQQNFFNDLTGSGN